MGISPTRVEQQNLELQQQGGGDNQNSLMKMASLRREFERVRLLSELVKKREKLKKESLSFDEKLLSMITPVAILIKRTLEKLISKDHQEVYFFIFNSFWDQPMVNTQKVNSQKVKLP